MGKLPKPEMIFCFGQTPKARQNDISCFGQTPKGRRNDISAFGQISETGKNLPRKIKIHHRIKNGIGGLALGFRAGFRAGFRSTRLSTRTALE